MSMDGRICEPEDPQDVSCDVIEVFNSPEWTPRQALLSALNSQLDDAQFLVIAVRDTDSTWKCSTSTGTVGDILTAARYLQLSADKYLLCEEDYEDDYEEA